jgi:hypothetical protein
MLINGNYFGAIFDPYALYSFAFCFCMNLCDRVLFTALLLCSARYVVLVLVITICQFCIVCESSLHY